MGEKISAKMAARCMYNSDVQGDVMYNVMELDCGDRRMMIRLLMMCPAQDLVRRARKRWERGGTKEGGARHPYGGPASPSQGRATLTATARVAPARCAAGAPPINR